jgi:hypothetical protein
VLGAAAVPVFPTLFDIFMGLRLVQWGVKGCSVPSQPGGVPTSVRDPVRLGMTYFHRGAQRVDQWG